MDPKTMRAYVSIMLRNKNFTPHVWEVDDICQEACLGALENGVCMDTKQFRGFLVICTLRYMQKTYRKKPVDPIGSARHMVSDEPSPLETVILTEDIRNLESAMGSLQPYLRQTVMLTLDGMTPAQIAEILGVKSTTVRVNKVRVKDELRNILGL